ncbi:hypothetical protein PR048_001800 [Dryococelus australis]|uniref:Uncharacterized protein n=1 Tax=Dryococelus australis TaxID=614101 RepID=A0ABQ9III7_9NEOP|nr:hypothetical protein PR048_001800 [Dryococelus australis]
MSTERLQSFSVAEKFDNLGEAKANGNCAAGKKFDGDKYCTQDSWKNKNKLLSASEKLLACIAEKRQFRYTVSTEMCSLKVLQSVTESFSKIHGKKWFVHETPYNDITLFACNLKVKSDCVLKIHLHKHRYLFSQIGNVDQTPVYKKVILTILSDGKKLPLFKTKLLPKGKKFPHSVIARAQ